MANGEVIRSLGYAKLQLQLVGYYSNVTADVLPNFIPGVDIILGDDWLRESRTHLDYYTTTCTVQNGLRRTALTPDRSASSKSTTLSELRRPSSQ